MSPRRGVTLVEMLVVVTLIGVIASIGGMGLASLHRPAADPWNLAVTRARARAVDSGVAITLRADSMHAAVLLLPDGRAIGAGVDPLTGEVVHAGR